MLRPQLPVSAALVVHHGAIYEAKRVVPFYSHTKRSWEEEQEDGELGIDRRAFSNLYPAPVTLNSRIVNGIEIVLHDELVGKTWRSTENLFQAAKCTVLADALFLLRHLSPSQAAAYGQGRLNLTKDLKDKLLECGLAESGVVQSNGKWKRAPAGRYPLRSDWEAVKPQVMLTALRLKFQSEPLRDQLMGTGSAGAFLVEHTTNDSCWGDGGDGHGCNMLGKLLVQVQMEGGVAGTKEAKHQPPDHNYLATPSNNLLRYD
eukprot:Colp12_sorted_trinity150504_noHs@7526